MATAGLNSKKIKRTAVNFCLYISVGIPYYVSLSVRGIASVEREFASKKPKQKRAGLSRPSPKNERNYSLMKNDSDADTPILLRAALNRDVAKILIAEEDRIKVNLDKPQSNPLVEIDVNTGAEHHCEVI